MNFKHWLVVIPARLKSERLPRKPLADLSGKPLVVRVYENLAPLKALGASIVVALDHSDTAKVCETFKIPFVMTDEKLPSGTDRCESAAQSFPEAKFILNVQGDEPFIRTEDLVRLMETMHRTDASMGTLGYRNHEWKQYIDPNVVKIVMGDDGVAIYFSRASVPFERDASRNGSNTVSFWQHLGVYAYKRDALRDFCRLKPSPLEPTEKLEQLRALSAGWKIKVVEAQSKS
jgi:3-deoxy-manno-octulosonate cytidylyltransferase (CMP-KDO synthetase)